MSDMPQAQALVGRDAELTALRAALAGAHDGAGGLAMSEQRAPSMGSLSRAAVAGRRWVTRAAATPSPRPPCVDNGATSSTNSSRTSRHHACAPTDARGPSTGQRSDRGQRRSGSSRRSGRVETRPRPRSSWRAPRLPLQVNRRSRLAGVSSVGSAAARRSGRRPPDAPRLRPSRQPSAWLRL